MVFKIQKQKPIMISNREYFNKTIISFDSFTFTDPNEVRQSTDAVVGH